MTDQPEYKMPVLPIPATVIRAGDRVIIFCAQPDNSDHLDEICNELGRVVPGVSFTAVSGVTSVLVQPGYITNPGQVAK